MKYLSTSPKQTFNLAKKFAKKLRGGEIIGLIGELGAGKTVFVKGLAAGLGIKKTITSPTFVLMKIYPVKSRFNSGARSAFNRVNPKSQILNLVHVDAYRLKSAYDALTIGAPEYLGRPDTVTAIEWADKICPAPLKRVGAKRILPKKTRYVNIINKGGNKRLIKY